MFKSIEIEDVLPQLNDEKLNFLKEEACDSYLDYSEGKQLNAKIIQDHVIKKIFYYLKDQQDYWGASSEAMYCYVTSSAGEHSNKKMAVITSVFRAPSKIISVEHRSFKPGMDFDEILKYLQHEQYGSDIESLKYAIISKVFNITVDTDHKSETIIDIVIKVLKNNLKNVLDIFNKNAEHLIPRYDN